MPPVAIDPNLGAGQFLAGPYDANKSSEHETLAVSQGVLGDGRAMAKMTGGANIGKVQPFVVGGADGSGVLYGYLFGKKANSAATQRVVIVVRDQLVNGNLVSYAGGTSENQKIAAEATAKDRGLVVRR
jgi:hypothetical protein